MRNSYSTVCKIVGFDSAEGPGRWCLEHEQEVPLDGTLRCFRGRVLVRQAAILAEETARRARTIEETVRDTDHLHRFGGE